MSATLAPSSRLAGRRLFRVVTAFLVSSLFTIHAFAEQATLAWDPISDSRVTGYNVHYGTQSGTYTSIYSAGSATSATVSGLAEGQTYYFVVRSRDAAGNESANSNQVSKTIPAAAPVASITATPTSGTAPLAVAFTSTVTGATSYTWNFGDNAISTNVQNPSHTYTAAGTYTASLSATGPGGTVVQSKNISVSAPTSGSDGGSTDSPSQTPESIILSPSSDVAIAPGTRLQFAGSGSSSSLPLTYSWDFGDGGRSTRQNPRHTYSTAGTYTARLTVKDAKGLTDPTPAMVAVAVGSPTPTPTPTPIPPTTSSYTLWPASAAPNNPSDPDTASVNLGVKFKSSQNGYISGIRFYKSTANTGTHVGTLWSSSGQKLATATFTNETASGWQQVNFATPVAITANTVYVASYLAPKGHYANDDNYFASTGVDSGPLHALSKPESGGNGVYAYGTTTAFPNTRYQATNYWIDVVFKLTN